MSADDVLPSHASRTAYLHTEFLERVAHELRGPVGVSSGALDEIELALGSDAEALRTYFLMARRGLQRILRMAERLQRTAQLEGGSIDWAKTPTDLRRFVEEVVQQTELLEARRAVSVDVSSTDVPCSVIVDPAWMRTAVAELVANAIRFARSRVSIHTTIAAGEVKITITDDGPGFTGPLARRFEPPSDKRGVGLSLPLVSDVVTSHGGRIEIDGDRASDGSTSPGAHVIVYLPLAKASET